MADIKKAEVDTPEAEKIFQELKEEFMQRYWKMSTSFEDAGTSNAISV